MSEIFYSYILCESSATKKKVKEFNIYWSQKLQELNQVPPNQNPIMQINKGICFSKKCTRVIITPAI